MPENAKVQFPGAVGCGVSAGVLVCRKQNCERSACEREGVAAEEVTPKGSEKAPICAAALPEQRQRALFWSTRRGI